MNQEKNMIKKIAAFLTLFIFSWVLTGAPAFAKKDSGDKPHGWSEGKKTGWDGGDMPPGLARQKERKEHRKEKRHDKKEKKEKREHKKEKKEKHDEKEEVKDSASE